MWVFVSENDGYLKEQDGYTPTYIPKGTYFYKTEDFVNEFGQYGYYWYSSRFNKWAGDIPLWGDISETETVLSAYKKLDDGTFDSHKIWLRRLDVWNCEKYGWCTNPAGSHYSIRQNFHIYRKDGAYMGYIGTNKTPIFKYGMGYTKQTGIIEIVSNAPLIRVAGYRNSDGSYYWYDTNNEYYASETQWKDHPNNYIINTL